MTRAGPRNGSAAAFVTAAAPPTLSTTPPEDTAERNLVLRTEVLLFEESMRLDLEALKAGTLERTSAMYLRLANFAYRACDRQLLLEVREAVL
jgi:hypothetical protein